MTPPLKRRDAVVQAKVVVSVVTVSIGSESRLVVEAGDEGGAGVVPASLCSRALYTPPVTPQTASPRGRLDL